METLNGMQVHIHSFLNHNLCLNRILKKEKVKKITIYCVNRKMFYIK